MAPDAARALAEKQFLTEFENAEVLIVRKLLQLSKLEAWLLFQAVVLLPTVRLALNFITVSRLKDLGTRTVRELRDPRLPPQTTARMVRVAAQRGLYRAKCLDQSLVLCWLLRRQGIDAQIVFGARKEDEQMEAHAWIEVDGISLDEDDNPHRRFSTFEGLAAAQFPNRFAAHDDAKTTVADISEKYSE